MYSLIPCDILLKSAKTWRCIDMVKHHIICSETVWVEILPDLILTEHFFSLGDSISYASLTKLLWYIKMLYSIWLYQFRGSTFQTVPMCFYAENKIIASLHTNMILKFVLNSIIACFVSMCSEPTITDTNNRVTSDHQIIMSVWIMMKRWFGRWTPH